MSDLGISRPSTATGDDDATARRRPVPLILLIEDDADIRVLFRTRLERLGYEVVDAGSGNDGLRLAGEARPDLVMLDLVLPDLDGWEVTRRLREDPGTADMPILVASILDGSPEEHAEVSGYLVKPFPMSRMEAAVSRIVGPATRQETSS